MTIAVTPLRDSPRPVARWVSTTWLWRGMLVLVLLAQLPHIGQVPLWLIGSAGVAALWRLAVTVWPWSVPSRWLVALLAAGTVAGLRVHAGQWFSQEFGTGLLVAASGLKAAESVSRRDLLVLVVVVYLMLAAVFINNEALPMTVLVLGLACLNTVMLVQLQQHPSLLPWPTCARLALVTLAQAVPLALICFILFPRLPGPLWGRLPQHHEALSGLSEEMAPDTIRSLALSEEVVLRAEIPVNMAADTLYWRGPVLWDFDGHTWRQGPLNEGNNTPATRTLQEKATQGWRQTIILEPSGQPWLLALDVPVASDVPGSTLRDGSLRNAWPLWERQRYQAFSVPASPPAPLPASVWQRALRLPLEGNPQARQLAQRWRNQPADQVIQSARRWFKAGHFRYTLEPGTTTNQDSVDAFLFDTRSGFCEHFASALTFLLRGAGVPARIVTGYHGGAWNPWGHYVLVRQSSAHAWVEAHVNGRWLRLDPVAWIGITDAGRLELSDHRRAADDPMLHWLMDDTGLLQRLALGWDAVHTAWNDWVLSYGADRQRATLSWLRLGGLSRQEIAMLMVVLVLLGVLTLDWLGCVRWTHGDGVSRRYGRFCRAMARRGCPMQPWEGPVTFAQRAATQYPDMAGAIWRVTNAYVALHYGPSPEPAERKRLWRELSF